MKGFRMMQLVSLYFLAWIEASLGGFRKGYLLQGIFRARQFLNNVNIRS
jgi:hypothetical protein